MAKLQRAWICLDCEEVYSGGGRGACPGQCPVCGSRAAWPLRRWVRPSTDVLAGAAHRLEPASVASGVNR